MISSFVDSQESSLLADLLGKGECLNKEIIVANSLDGSFSDTRTALPGMGLLEMSLCSHMNSYEISELVEARVSNSLSLDRYSADCGNDCDSHRNENAAERIAQSNHSSPVHLIDQSLPLFDSKRFKNSQDIRVFRICFDHIVMFRSMTASTFGSGWQIRFKLPNLSHSPIPSFSFKHSTARGQQAKGIVSLPIPWRNSSTTIMSQRHPAVSKKLGYKLAISSKTSSRLRQGFGSIDISLGETFLREECACAITLDNSACQQWLDSTLEIFLVDGASLEPARNKSNLSYSASTMLINIDKFVGIARIPLRDLLSSPDFHIASNFEFVEIMDSFSNLKQAKKFLSQFDDAHNSRCDIYKCSSQPDKIFILGKKSIGTIYLKIELLPGELNQIQTTHTPNTHITRCDEYPGNKKHIDSDISILKNQPENSMKIDSKASTFPPNYSTKNSYPKSPPPKPVDMHFSRPDFSAYEAQGRDIKQIEPSKHPSTIKMNQLRNILVRLHGIYGLNMEDILQSDRNISFSSSSPRMTHISTRKVKGLWVCYAISDGNQILSRHYAPGSRSDKTTWNLSHETSTFATADVVREEKCLIFEVWLSFDSDSTSSSINYDQEKTDDLLIGLTKVPLTPLGKGSMVDTNENLIVIDGLVPIQDLLREINLGSLRVSVTITSGLTTLPSASTVSRTKRFKTQAFDGYSPIKKSDINSIKMEKFDLISQIKESDVNHMNMEKYDSISQNSGNLEYLSKSTPNFHDEKDVNYGDTSSESSLTFLVRQLNSIPSTKNIPKKSRKTKQKLSDLKANSTFSLTLHQNRTEILSKNDEANISSVSDSLIRQLNDEPSLTSSSKRYQNLEQNYAADSSVKISNISPKEIQNSDEALSKKVDANFFEMSESFTRQLNQPDETSFKQNGKEKMTDFTSVNLAKSSERGKFHVKKLVPGNFASDSLCQPSKLVRHVIELSIRGEIPIPNSFIPKNQKSGQIGCKIIYAWESEPSKFRENRLYSDAIESNEYLWWDSVSEILNNRNRHEFDLPEEKAEKEDLVECLIGQKDATPLQIWTEFLIHGEKVLLGRAYLDRFTLLELLKDDEKSLEVELDVVQEFNVPFDIPSVLRLNISHYCMHDSNSNKYSNVPNQYSAENLNVSNPTNLKNLCISIPRITGLPLDFGYPMTWVTASFFTKHGEIYIKSDPNFPILEKYISPAIDVDSEGCVMLKWLAEIPVLMDREFVSSAHILQFGVFCGNSLKEGTLRSGIKLGTVDLNISPLLHQETTAVKENLSFHNTDISIEVFLKNSESDISKSFDYEMEECRAPSKEKDLDLKKMKKFSKFTHIKTSNSMSPNSANPVSSALHCSESNFHNNTMQKRHNNVDSMANEQSQSNQYNLFDILQVNNSMQSTFLSPAKTRQMPNFMTGLFSSTLFDEDLHADAAWEDDVVCESVLEIAIDRAANLVFSESICAAEDEEISTYVTCSFERAERNWLDEYTRTSQQSGAIMTSLVVHKSNPVYGFKGVLPFSNELSEESLQFKLWVKNCEQTSDFEDLLIGTANVDISALKRHGNSSFPEIDGWYHILDRFSEIRGQLRVRIVSKLCEKDPLKSECKKPNKCIKQNKYEDMEIGLNRVSSISQGTNVFEDAPSKIYWRDMNETQNRSVQADKYDTFANSHSMITTRNVDHLIKPLGSPMGVIRRNVSKNLNRPVPSNRINKKKSFLSDRTEPHPEFDYLIGSSVLPMTQNGLNLFDLSKADRITLQTDQLTLKDSSQMLNTCTVHHYSTDESREHSGFVEINQLLLDLESMNSSLRDLGKNIPTDAENLSISNNAAIRIQRTFRGWAGRNYSKTRKEQIISSIRRRENSVVRIQSWIHGIFAVQKFKIMQNNLRKLKRMTFLKKLVNYFFVIRIQNWWKMLLLCKNQNSAAIQIQTASRRFLSRCKLKKLKIAKKSELIGAKLQQKQISERLNQTFFQNPPKHDKAVQTDIQNNLLSKQVAKNIITTGKTEIFDPDCQSSLKNYIDFCKVEIEHKFTQTEGESKEIAHNASTDDYAGTVKKYNDFTNEEHKIFTSLQKEKMFEISDPANENQNFEGYGEQFSNKFDKLTIEAKSTNSKNPKCLTSKNVLKSISSARALEDMEISHTKISEFDKHEDSQVKMNHNYRLLKARRFADAETTRIARIMQGSLSFFKAESDDSS